MKIRHKTKDPNKRAAKARALADPEPSLNDFVKAFIADHEANPSKLTPALRAFVEGHLAKRAKARKLRASAQGEGD